MQPVFVETRLNFSHPYDGKTTTKTEIRKKIDCEKIFFLPSMTKHGGSVDIKKKTSVVLSRSSLNQPSTAKSMLGPRLGRCCGSIPRRSAVTVQWRRHVGGSSSSFLRSQRGRSSPRRAHKKSSAVGGGGGDPNERTVAALRSEIQRLQEAVQEANAAHGRSLERLRRQVEGQPRALERHLLESLQQQQSKAGAGGSAVPQIVDQFSKAARDYVQHNESLQRFLSEYNRQANRHPNLLNRYTAAGLILVLLVVWWYWASIQKRTSEEVAEIASQTLAQNKLRQSIQETIDSLAHSPEIFITLTHLLESVMEDETTQHNLVHLLVQAVQTDEVRTALLELLTHVFTNPDLQETAGEFLLRGLDVEHVRAQLDAQTAGLVERTVANESVQQATARGVRRSLKLAANPFR